ncbi:MAG: M28 family peptidase [Muribaculaceae bacterium]|nr:M28 family peptidase [Muribaculaceae bacterium]
MRIIIAALAAIAIVGCGSSKQGKADDHSAPRDTMTVTAPKFNADTAYSYVDRQVSFGPRVPGTEGHRVCAEFIKDVLKANGVDTIIEQTAEVEAFNGDKLNILNIMGRFAPEAKERLLIVAHYDTRPWADNETDVSRHRQPILGANDGASGVGVMLELSRALGHVSPGIGVDLLFVDAEDYGDSDGWNSNEDTWCLGTQYWVKNMPYGSDTKPLYGIVLDMVGGTDAVFHREYTSDRVAKGVNDKVWNIAALSGYDHKFINSTGGGIVDDHLFINRAGIPCIDIVECNNPTTGAFPTTWHTLNDDMAHIDRESLQAVGQVVMNVIYNENTD